MIEDYLLVLKVPYFLLREYEANTVTQTTQVSNQFMSYVYLNQACYHYSMLSNLNATNHKITTFKIIL
jgi:hypothetical protein